MKPSGTHGLVILSLAVISSYGVVAGIGDNENRLGIVVGNRSANRSVFYKSFDVHKCLLLRLLPLEYDTLLSKSREEGRVLSEPGDESTNIIDKTKESSYFWDITRGWPVDDLLDLRCSNFKPIWRDNVPKEFDLLCK
jgi:hypothetical protein